ncbi:MAG TPA: hypothetical protein VLL52_00590 [Anaerolineae bacterium]|nr:hypothetical protein [Anaerolineae bacterium]
MTKKLKTTLLLTLLLTLITACTTTPAPTPTLTPTSLPPTAAPFERSNPTLPLAEARTVAEGGYTFQPVLGSIVSLNGPQAVVSDKDENAFVFLSSNPSNGNTVIVALDSFLEALTNDVGPLESSPPYSFNIAGQPGTAVDVTGDFLGDAMDGRIAVVPMPDGRLFVIYGFAINGYWTGDGELLFESVSGSVTFTP